MKPSPTDPKDQEAIGEEETSRYLRRAVETRSLDDEWKAVDRRKRRRERTIQAVTAQLFEEQARAVDEAIDEFRSLDDRSSRADKILMVDDLFDLPRWIGQTVSRLALPIMAAIEEGFKTGVIRGKIEGVDFSSDHEQVRLVIEELNDKLRDVPRVTRGRMSDAIQAGLQEGQSIDEIAVVLRQLFDGMKLSRARTIARTTGTAGFERGQKVAFLEGGIEIRSWLSQRDGKARPAHDEADGQEVGIDDPFEVGGEKLDHPGDPKGSPKNIINCRCTQLPVRVADD